MSNRGPSQATPAGSAFFGGLTNTTISSARGHSSPWPSTKLFRTAAPPSTSRCVHRRRPVHPASPPNPRPAAHAAAGAPPRPGPARLPCDRRGPRPRRPPPPPAPAKNRALGQLALGRRPKPAVQHDPCRLPPRPASIGQQRVVGQDRPDPHADAVALAPHLMNVLSRLRTGNPSSRRLLRKPPRPPRQRQQALRRLSPLADHPGPPPRAKFDVGRQNLPGLRGQHPRRHRQARLTQFQNPCPPPAGRDLPSRPPPA